MCRCVSHPTHLPYARKKIAWTPFTTCTRRCPKNAGLTTLQPRLAQVEVTPKGVAIVKMDVLGEKQNTFNQEFYQDMEAVNLLCKRKKQAAAQDAYGAMMSSLDSFNKLI